MLLERMRRLEEGEEEEVTREEINRIFEKEKEEASQQFDAYGRTLLGWCSTECTVVTGDRDF